MTIQTTPTFSRFSRQLPLLSLPRLEMKCPQCRGAGFLLEERTNLLIPCHCNPRRAEWFRKRTGLYGEFLDWRLEDTAPELDNLKMVAEKFAADPNGWLCFWGPYGTGKTWFLVGIVRRCLDRRTEARYIETENMLQEWRDTFDRTDVSFQQVFSEMCQIPVLALDELDKVRGTDWAIAQLQRVLHHRHNNRGKGTIFGMNADPALWLKKQGLASVLSRLQDRRNVGVFKCFGRDRRR